MPNGRDFDKESVHYMALEPSTLEWLNQLKYDERGLIPAIVQDQATQRVLMVAYMTRETLQQSLEIQETVFWSRSRREVWHKGATSGNTQKIHRIETDCDKDTLLIFVSPNGPACHTGEVSCFFNLIFSEGKGEPR
jgi:phosphoribosyl-AMP cyclohydrolase / phosphoribosyl-ATP pyrophosphohydrolase